MSNFEDLHLDPELLRALRAEGYERPTPIQTKAIPALLAGRDLLGCAQTGTGKTAAFALPTLQRLFANRRPAARRSMRALVLAPTRELALQVEASFRAYGRFLRPSTAVICGGVSQGPQVRALAHGLDVLVATPGRLLDLVQQGHVRFDSVEVFVLDEADRMLDMGFIHDVRRIVKAVPAERQSLLFSATLPPPIVDLARGIVRDPVRVEVSPGKPTVDRIDERLYHLDRGGKATFLRELLAGPDVERVIVFTRTKRRANILARQIGEGEVIHGNKSQNARVRALESFRAGRVRVLVATDIAARGIDVEGITHVVNFDLPSDPESYVHRIGRTARAGGRGTAISFCQPDEQEALAAIEKLLRRPIPVAGGTPSPATPKPRRAQGSQRSAKQGSQRPAKQGSQRPAKQGSQRPAKQGQGRRRRRPRGGTRGAASGAAGGLSSPAPVC